MRRLARRRERAGRRRRALCGSADAALMAVHRPLPVRAVMLAARLFHMRMPLIIVPITDSPLMMSSRNTMYMWISANSTRYHIARWCSVRTICGSPNSTNTQPISVHRPRAPAPLLGVEREAGDDDEDRAERVHREHRDLRQRIVADPQIGTPARNR